MIDEISCEKFFFIFLEIILVFVCWFKKKHYLCTRF